MKRPEYEKAIDPEDDLRQIEKLDPSVREGVRTSYLRDVEALKRHISPPGMPGLPKLLDERRVQFGIIDEAFAQQATYDYLFVHQITQLSGATFGDTSIIMPDTTRIREEREAPRGIIVSAGLAALDGLRSNGIDLGHIIAHIHNAPNRLRIAIIGGKAHSLLVLHAGDIIASEDLAVAMRNGECTVEGAEDPETQHTYHSLRSSVDGRVWKPARVRSSVL